MGPFEFVPAVNSSDFESSARLFTSLEPWISYGRDYEYNLHSVQDPLKELYVARLNGVFCGAVLLITKGAIVAYLQRIAVDTAYQGMGIGKKILEETEERVFRDFPNLFLTVAEFRTEAYTFYKGMGYDEIGIIKEYILPGVDEVMMRKTVGPANKFYEIRGT